ncbi:kinase-like domain-containing protein [Dactylonectria macrodidyma]|uniref:Kinase-like domain-containing protein n=1 Tax=Dactylonectria macrodidyma TaxID=307937 RepID=A0A9P9D6E5_9HYPO|nr:kinase-like domain-containing protein [Dactylonectria macrodidyma]
MGNGQGKPVDLNGEVNLNHFRLLRVVGRGAFGKVRIVERKDTNLSFALKYIRKDEVVRSKSVRNIIRERRMLEYLNHPFICNLRYSFQDIEYMYLVVDLMTGGDLRFHISRKTFTEEAVRFWIAELGCALRYIHSQSIIHRDIKPDNVLLDADGHVHLTDFNVASDVVAGRTLTSKSGTLAYLAPEVYAGKGYDVRADWWSLGVLFYECIYNKRPFEGDSKGSLSSQIQAANPKYPVAQPPVSLACLYAIGSALDPNRDTRMGSTWNSFANHEFFKVFDFELLEQKRIGPIFVPSFDKTNFDATYVLEELFFEEAPLEARARRQKPRERLKDDATDKEIRKDELYRMIETDFRPFDYTVAAYKKITEAAQGLNDEAQPDPDNAPQTITTDGATAMPATNGAYQSSPLNPSTSNESRQGRPSRPAPPPPYQNDFRNCHHPIITGQRVTSPTGGVRVTLDGGGSWSELARQDATLLTDANIAADSKNEGSGGMVGFLKSKKGRNNRPKPKERGVLGKQGARVVMASSHHLRRSRVSRG